MNDTVQKRSALRLTFSNGPLLATVLFCLAYGSVMVLLIAPRSLLSSSAADSQEIPPAFSAASENALSAGFSNGISANGTEAQLLKAGFTARPAEASVYGIKD